MPCRTARQGATSALHSPSGTQRRATRYSCRNPSYSCTRYSRGTHEALTSYSCRLRGTHAVITCSEALTRQSVTQLWAQNGNVASCRYRRYALTRHVCAYPATTCVAAVSCAPRMREAQDPARACVSCRICPAVSALPCLPAESALAPHATQTRDSLRTRASSDTGGRVRISLCYKVREP